ncbi:MAG: hypothetical protein PSX36_01785 [bacterium]|nr:hypothetical protein [bacterium]
MTTSAHIHASASFYQRMMGYADEYGAHVLLHKSDGSAIAQSMIIRQFLKFLWQQHAITNLQQVTVSMANSQFYAKYKQMNDSIISSTEMKNILKSFFTFVHLNHAVRSAKLMKGFEQRAKSD